MRLGAGAPEPTRPGGEAKTPDECLNPGATVPAPRGVTQRGVTRTINGTGGRHPEQVDAEGSPVPGQRAWLYADIPPSLDARYQETMKEHRVDNPLWRAGPVTRAMEKASRDRLRLYAEYKRKLIAETESSTLPEK